MLILFSAVRNRGSIATPGTSSRQQVKDGTGGKQPVEILWEELLRQVRKAS